MNTNENYFEDITNQKSFYLKALFLLGAISPLLSIILLFAALVINENLDQEQSKKIDTMCTFWSIFILIESIVFLFLGFEISKVSINPESTSLYALDTLSISSSVLFYFRLIVGFITGLFILKKKGLIIPIPSKLIIKFSSLSKALLKNLETKPTKKKEA